MKKEYVLINKKRKYITNNELMRGIKRVTKIQNAQFKFVQNEIKKGRKVTNKKLPLILIFSNGLF